MSLLWRKPCSLSCLAVFAVIVLVACSSGPGVAAPTVKDGAGKILAAILPLKVDETSKPVSLSGVFTGASLEYSTASSDEAVATAAIANGTLTITAHKAGPATITVTAKNAGGSAKYEVKVTVTAKSSGPGPGTGAAPTVKDAAPTSFGIDEGETEEVDLSDVFEGEGLTYPVAPESDDTDVAIAAIDDDVLIIRAGDPGEATITVTATNPRGSVKHQITVTVSDPDDGDGGDDSGDQGNQLSATCRYPPAVRVTIDLGRTKKCTIPKLYTLNPDSDGVETREDLSDKTGMAWLVTANKKGTHDITVHDGAGKPLAGKITVVVPNSSPYLSDSSKTIPIQLTGSAGHHSTTERSLDGKTFHDYFRDLDGDTSFIYRIVDQPKWVLIETKNGFVVTTQDPVTTTTPPDTEIKSAATGLHMEVLNAMEDDSTFTVSLVASDGSDESELPVVLTFQADGGLLPRKVTNYEATQTRDGSFKAKNGELIETALKVGPRRGVDHTLTFLSYEGTGFRLANKLVEDWSDYLSNTQITALPDTFVTKPDTPTIGAAFFTLDGTAPSSMKVKWSTATASPVIQFKLEEKGSPGSIRIKYSLYISDTKKNPDGSLPGTAKVRTTPKTITKTLSVTVVPCSSPPKPIGDCP